MALEYSLPVHSQGYANTKSNSVATVQGILLVSNWMTTIQKKTKTALETPLLLVGLVGPPVPARSSSMRVEVLVISLLLLPVFIHPSLISETTLL